MKANITHFPGPANGRPGGNQCVKLYEKPRPSFPPVPTSSLPMKTGLNLIEPVQTLLTVNRYLLASTSLPFSQVPHAVEDHREVKREPRRVKSMSATVSSVSRTWRS
ncbi:hypothetical protein PAAG_12320 [Paracoccidioides lutzii Pb01]|uniref:Uncharacterized protein n=1 Tax=Paracoccidioides lutzii (strain ATCC MYA-826 / Pb01) TaxID=502779 RepID=A0A0A2V0H4_PARBA|nr:hypothetical protein PAAG_12320 [Paracoccidioides lutzii Pb01]KGQ01008.1 hypothetical protein PAAG_12320 [Paracoccidioides lutzii Pb01]